MTRIYHSLSRLGKLLALLAPALLWLASPAHGGDELPVSCNRMAKVLATGTIADRNSLAKLVTAPAERVAVTCAVELMRAFGDPLRAHLPAPSMQAWSAENQWLAALVRSFVPQASAQWAPKLDIRVLPDAQLADLVVYWTGVTETADMVFATLNRIKAQTLRNEILHRADVWLMRLETTDVTAATRTASALENLGFGFLAADPELASLWTLRGGSAPASVIDAELRLAKGDVSGAFVRYVEAAQNEVRYRLHVGILADRLFRSAKPDSTRLMALGIAYSRCEDGYRVHWEYGGLYPLLSSADPELRAEARLRAREKCVDVPELPDDLEDIDQQYKDLYKGYDGTGAAWRRKLAYLDRVRAAADELGDHGRLILANELREWIWRRTEPPTAFRLLGGPTHARKLRAQIRGYLAFPPEPEVHVNER